MTRMKEMEIWTCKRYSREYPKLCVEPGKISVIPVSEHNQILKRELERKCVSLKKKIRELEGELSIKKDKSTRLRTE